jgi:protein-S-isoprenylcysteine O-methyltransferase Ste14
MNVFFAAIAQVWYVPIFVAFLVAIGVLSQRGTIKTWVHRARPGLAWAMFLGAIVFAAVLIVGASFVTHREVTGESLNSIMYVTAFSIPVFAIALIYLFSASNPPRFLIPAWLLAERDSTGKKRKATQ